jgi:hypothetical protein
MQHFGSFRLETADHNTRLLHPTLHVHRGNKTIAAFVKNAKRTTDFFEDFT